MDLAARERNPAAAVDWLGLALLAAQSYRQDAGRLVTEDSADLQEKCRAAARLAELLTQISEQRARAIQERFAVLARDAAPAHLG